MRDPNRIDAILKELEIYWKKNPDFRLGQILFNAHSALRIKGDTKSDLYNMEEQELLEGLNLLKD